MKQIAVTALIVLLTLYGCYRCAEVLTVSPNYVTHYGAEQ